jgi:hypothetical protein
MRERLQYLRRARFPLGAFLLFWSSPAAWAGGGAASSGEPEATGGNTVGLGAAAGQSGEVVTVPLSLDNRDPMRGLQLDILFDVTAARYVTATPVGRGAGLEVRFQSGTRGRVRGVLLYADEHVLPAGDGVIADLSFRLAGPSGGQTTLSPVNLVFSDPDAEPRDVGGESGSLSVTGGPVRSPDVDVAVLENPARVRSLHVYVTVVDGSGDVPALRVGDVEVVPESLGSDIFLAVRHLEAGAAEVAIAASDTNGIGTGSDAVTVVFAPNAR